MPKGSSFLTTDWVAASSMGKKQVLMKLVQTEQAIWGKNKNLNKSRLRLPHN